MKKNLLLGCALAAFALNANAQIIFSEDFDGVGGGGAAGTYVFPAGWSLFNVDNLIPAAPVAYVDQAWERREDFAGNLADSAAFSTSWYDPAGTADDWMFTPAITLPAGANSLSWEGLTYDASYPDGYEVRIMTTAPTAGNLMTSTVLFSVAAENTTWTPRTVSLAGYTGTVYIAFRNNSVNQFVLLIDDIVVESIGISDDAELVSLDETMEYTMIPSSQVAAMPTLATVANAGANDLSDVALKLNIYDQAMALVSTQTGTATATMAIGATAQLSAGDFTLPAVAGNYMLEYVVTHAATDNDMSNDTLFDMIMVTDTVYARDNGVDDGGIGIGAGEIAYLGQAFTLNADAEVSSITFSVNGGYIGRQAACVIWDVASGTPNAIIASTDTMLYPDNNAAVYTLGISGGSMMLNAGTYVVTAIEFDSTLQLTTTTGITTAGTAWVNWPSNPFGGWTNPEAFGPTFAKNLYLRMNFATQVSCAGFSASTSFTDATCDVCADGTATATATGGATPYTYAWNNGNTNATATGLTTGSYDVTVTDANGCQVTETVFVDFLSGTTTIANSNIRVYPNPSNGVFNVNIPASFGDNTTVTVMNTIGEVVYTSIVNGTEEISLKNLTAGSYLVRFANDKNTASQKITIVR